MTIIKYINFEYIILISKKYRSRLI